MQIVQTRRDAEAAKRLLTRLLKKQGWPPRRMISDKLGSYAAARRQIMPAMAADDRGGHGLAKAGVCAETRAIGSMPAVIAAIVMTTGRARARQASMTASRRDSPRSRKPTIAYSTSRIEFFETMPISMIRGR